LRRAVPLPAAVVDVSFAAPDRAWGAGVTRPTVNVFLWDIRRNLALSTTGLGQHYSDGHQVLRRPTDPVVDLRYLVTAWATEQGDEHQLLGSVLRSVVAHSALPEADLPKPLQGSPFVKLALASEEARVPGEFWSALDGRLKPGLQVVVTLPVGAFEWVPAGPPATSVTVVPRLMGTAAPADGPGAQKPAPANTDPHRARLAVHPLRRWRRNGALTMEGRPSAPGKEGRKGG